MKERVLILAISLCVEFAGLNVALAADQGQSQKKDSSGTSATNASASGSTSNSNKQSNILDFDADVIEGERSGPSIMVQMDLQAPNLDTLVFQRKNFNDFHVIDMKRKPKYRGQ